MLIKCNLLGPGPGPSEKVVSITTRDGEAEEVILSTHDLENNYLEVGSPLALEDNSYLIELPREAASGKWRIWVSTDQAFNQKRPQAAE
jgi:hypothetical protein